MNECCYAYTLLARSTTTGVIVFGTQIPFISAGLGLLSGHEALNGRFHLSCFVLQREKGRREGITALVAAG